RALRAARIRARDPRRDLREDRPRRAAALADRDRGGARGRGRGVLDDAAQTEPGRVHARARVREARAGGRVGSVRLARAGARARGRAVPGLVTTVVLCGSLGSSSAMWDAQLPALSAHDLVLVDHPGHGGAPLADVWGVADLARRVPGERFSLVGLSLGGAVGM